MKNNTSILLCGCIDCSIPDVTVVNGEQINWVGSGIQFPLLWHVTVTICDIMSHSQISNKTDLEPSRVEV